MIRCASCGTENPDDNNFCDQCGLRFANEVATNTGNSVEYVNNPFASDESVTTTSSSSNEYHNEEFNNNSSTKQDNNSDATDSESAGTIKKCSRCSGSGKIREEVPSIIGKSYVLNTCPKCHGIGRYVVGPDGHFRDTSVYSSDATSDTNLNSQLPIQRKTTPQLSSTHILIIAVFFVFFIITFIVVGIARNRANAILSAAREATTTVATNETLAESTTETTPETSLDIAFTTITYQDMSIEIPESWYEISVDSTNDTTLAYSNNPEGEPANYGVAFQFYADDITDEDKQSNIINNFSEAYDDATFTDTELGGHYALQITYTDSNGFYCYEYLVNSQGGYIRIGYAYKPELESELMPIYDYILNSCEFPDGNAPTSDISYTTYSYENFTFDLPDSWVELNAFDSNLFRYGDSEYAYCELKGFRYLYGEDYKTSYVTDYLDFEQAREKLIDEYTNSFNNGDYDSFDYEDVTINEHQALKVTLTSEDYWSIRCYIDNGDYLYEFFMYSNNSEFMPIAEDIIDSIAIDNSEAPPTTTTTEPTTDPLEGISFTSTPFHGMTFDIPSDWVVADFVESEYGNGIIAVRYADSASDPTFICDIYYDDMMFGDDIEDMCEDFVEISSENSNNSEYYLTNIGAYTVGVVTVDYDNYIDVVYFVQTSEGGNMVDFYYPSEMDGEMTAIIEYFFDSIDID